MKRYVLMVLALLVVTPVFAGAQTLQLESQEHMKATVLSVESQESRLIPGTDTTSMYQTLRVRIENGSEEGAEVLVENDYLELSPGDTFYLAHIVSDLGGIDRYTVVEPYRVAALMWLTGLFILSVLLFGGWQGIRGLAALIGSLLAIFFLLLPGILAGYSPVLLSLGVAAVIVTLGSYVTHGFNKTTSAAVIGMLLTVVATGVLAYYSIDIAQLSGFSSDESIYLNFNTRGDIDLVGLLLGGMLIGLLGVLYDAAIGQAVAVDELRRVGPHLSRRFIYTRGLRMGREHIGALVNTLAIAYVGVSLPLLLLFYFSSDSLAFIVNQEVFATEVVRTMVGSIGLVLTVPITTLIAVMMLVVPQRSADRAVIEAEREAASHAGHHH